MTYFLFCHKSGEVGVGLFPNCSILSCTDHKRLSGPVQAEHWSVSATSEEDG